MWISNQRVIEEAWLQTDQKVSEYDHYMDIRENKEQICCASCEDFYSLWVYARDVCVRIRNLKVYRAKERAKIDIYRDYARGYEDLFQYATVIHKYDPSVIY